MPPKMAEPPIHFFYEKISFKLRNVRLLKFWMSNSVMSENKKIEEINVIFCEDSYIKKINKQFLNHDYYTDIITFDYSENEHKLIGDIFISIDRARDNAKQFRQKLAMEVNRLIIHGILHLIGYNDKSSEEKKLMTTKENYYLEMLLQ